MRHATAIAARRRGDAGPSRGLRGGRVHGGRRVPAGHRGADLPRGFQLHCHADTLCVQLKEGAGRPRGVFRIGQMALDGGVKAGQPLRAARARRP